MVSDMDTNTRTIREWVAVDVPTLKMNYRLTFFWSITLMTLSQKMGNPILKSIRLFRANGVNARLLI